MWVWVSNACRVCWCRRLVVWVSKACRCVCRRLVGCLWVSKACRMCECRRLVGYVGVEGL